MLIITLAVGVPAVMNVFNLGRVTQLDVESGGLLTTGADNVLWAAFLSIVGGLVASGLGGMIGGAITSPANAHLADDVRTETEVVERPVSDDRDTVVVGEAEEVDEEEARSARYHRAS
jgi:hypothetical protein